MGDGISRSELVDGLLASGATPFRRETLERMSPEGLAQVVNASEATAEEIVAAAEGADLEAGAILEEPGGGGEGPAVTGVLADPPEADPGADPSGGLAVLEEPEGDEELGFEVRNVLDGPAGESVLDDDGPTDDGGDDDAGDLGFEVGGVLD